jgi:hypothetical protein
VTFAPVAHLIGGPLDALLEFGIPVVILVALWAWSKRAERQRKADAEQAEDERRP